LGSGKTSTAQERLEKIESKEVLHAIHSRQRSNRFADIAESDDSGEEDVGNTYDVHYECDRDQQDGDGASPRGQVIIVDSAPIGTRRQAVSADVVIGSALQRNTDGSIMEPRVMKKKDKSAGVCSISLFFLC
jgi:ATP-dependent RNA helicase DHX37/DHR1